MLMKAVNKLQQESTQQKIRKANGKLTNKLFSIFFIFGMN